MICAASGLGVMIVNVVVGKRNVEWILPRNEIDRHKMEACPGDLGCRCPRNWMSRQPSHALLSFPTGLLSVACSPIQKTVVEIPTFQAYSPVPVPRLFFSLTVEPVPSISPGTCSPFLAGSLMTLGSILTKVFSGNFIAYFAISVVLSDRDCAQTWVPGWPETQHPKQAELSIQSRHETQFRSGPRCSAKLLDPSIRRNSTSTPNCRSTIAVCGLLTILNAGKTQCGQYRAYRCRPAEGA